MCGFSGLLLREDKAKPREVFINVSKEFLRERGPDHFAYNRITDRLTLTHARLSIIDLATGDQPKEDADSVIAFNGEIYNYRELREPSIHYATHSDTEVLQKGINKHGIDFLRQADGMFAFAHYNKHTRELTLARDSFGIKPLYYFKSQDVFAFASRIQPLMPFSQAEIDRDALVQYYATRAVRTPRTIFTDIKEVEPGHALVINTDTLEIKHITKWALPFKASRHIKNEAEALANLEAALKLAVQRHLVSDVPVASFLSGGVDSSLLTALAAEQNPDIHAFSIGFKESKFDETQYANAVSQRYGIKHHVHYCGHQDFLELLEQWPMIVDDAVADPSAVMLAVISRFARQLGYKVALSGEGADELFAGYNQYYRFLLSQKLNKFCRFTPFAGSILEALVPNKTRHIQFAHHAASDPNFYGTGRIFEPYLLKRLTNIEGMEFPKVSTLSDALELDIYHRLPDDILTRTDRATMHYSIESRVPFMTRYVWQAAADMDETLLINGKTQKYILKKLAEKYVPHECLYRRKVGFDLPLAEWWRGPLKEFMQESLRNSWQEDYLHKGYIASVVDDHTHMRNDNADKIWAFVLLENNVKQLRSVKAASPL